MFALLRRHDWPLNLSILVLGAAGLVIIYSISVSLFWQQLLWFAIAAVLIVVLSFNNWQSLANYRWIILGVYFSAILLLIATYLFAPEIRQAKSWLVIGPIQFQTSEFAKLALIILFASFFTKRHISIAHPIILFKTFLYFLIPALLILAQPDLGTFIILLGLWLGFLVVSGLRRRHIIIGLIILSLLSALAWQFFLQDYQRARIVSLFNPEYDPLRTGYSVIQSKIAIGSAGFLGKGFQQGTQVQLGFLPEAATDFIFAAFIEEWGLLGGLVIIAAFVFMIYRVIKIGMFSEDNFSRFICLGAAIMFLIQFVLNTGSVIGLLPVVGVTFPFFSYGGSSILINAALIGIVQSIAARTRF